MIYSEDTMHRQQSIAVRTMGLSKSVYSLAAVALLFVALGGFAQETTPTEPPAVQNPPQQPASGITITLPAGTRIPLALQRGLSTKTSRPGSMAYLVTTAPVTSGDMVLIPPDTFVQGQIARITIPGVDQDGELQLRSAQIVFANGYTVSIPYDLVVPLDRQWIYPEAPGPGRALGVTAAFAAPAIGALVGGLTSFHSPPPLTLPVPGQPLTAPNLGNPVKSAAIGAGIGFAVTIPVVVALVRHHRDFIVEGGAPADMILARPLEFEADRIATAVRDAETEAANLPTLPMALRACPKSDVVVPPDMLVSGSRVIPRREYFCY
jgi:hypothetical protein